MNRQLGNRDYWSGAPEDPVGIIKNRQNDLKDGGEDVKVDKGAHQEKDGFGGCGLRWCGGDVSPVNVLDLLFVPVQDKNPAAAGPEPEPQTQHIRGW